MNDGKCQPCLEILFCDFSSSIGFSPMEDGKDQRKAEIKHYYTPNIPYAMLHGSFQLDEYIRTHKEDPLLRTYKSVTFIYLKTEAAEKEYRYNQQI